MSSSDSPKRAARSLVRVAAMTRFPSCRINSSIWTGSPTAGISHGISRPIDAVIVALRLLLLHDPTCFRGCERSVTISLGVSSFPSAETSAEAVLDATRQAMARARARGVADTSSRAPDDRAWSLGLGGGTLGLRLVAMTKGPRESRGPLAQR